MVNKKSIYLVGFIIGSILVLNGCNTTSKQSDAVHYFDLDSLMTEQLNVMLSKKVRLEKISLLDSKYDSVVFFPDSSQWAREFVIFQQNTIDKIKYKGLYKKKVSKDTQSNLDIITYLSKDNLQVPYLKLYFLNTPNNLRKIETAYFDKNSIYHSSRNLEIVFEDINDKVIIKEYSIDGYQKMIGVDTVKYEVRGRLSFE